MIKAYGKILIQLVELEKTATTPEDKVAYAYLVESVIPDEMEFWNERSKGEECDSCKFAATGQCTCNPEDV